MSQTIPAAQTKTPATQSADFAAAEMSGAELEGLTATEASRLEMSSGEAATPRQWDTTFNPYLGTLYNPDIRTDAKLENPLFQAYASANGLDPTAGSSLVQFKSYLSNEFGIDGSNASTKAVVAWGDQIPREMFIDQVVNEFGIDFRETINNSVDMQVALADRITDHGPGDLIDVSDFWQFSVKQSLDKAAQHPGGWLWRDVYKNPGSFYDGSVPVFSSALASYNLKSILSNDYGAAPKLREYNSRGLVLDLAVEFAALATPFKASNAGLPSLAEGAVGFRLAENASARIAQTGRLLDNLEASSLANATSNLSLHAKIERLIQSRVGPSKGATFASDDLLASHFKKHGAEFRTQSAEEYLQVGQDIIQNGHKVEYFYEPANEVRTGYVSFMRNSKKSGESLFGFVGTNADGAITTIHVKPRTELFDLLGDSAQSRLKIFRTDTVGPAPQNGWKYPYK